MIDLLKWFNVIHPLRALSHVQQLNLRDLRQQNVNALKGCTTGWAERSNFEVRDLSVGNAASCKVKAAANFAAKQRRKLRRRAVCSTFG